MKKEDIVLHALGHHIWVFLRWDERRHGTSSIDGDFECFLTVPAWIQEYHPFRICMICNRVEVARNREEWVEVFQDASYSKAWHAHIQQLSRDFYDQNR